MKKYLIFLLIYICSLSYLKADTDISKFKFGMYHFNKSEIDYVINNPDYYKTIVDLALKKDSKIYILAIISNRFRFTNKGFEKLSEDSFNYLCTIYSTGCNIGDIGNLESLGIDRLKLLKDNYNLMYSDLITRYSNLPNHEIRGRLLDKYLEFNYKKMELQDLIDLLTSNELDIRQLFYIKKEIINNKNIVPRIRVTLRHQGKSFVTKNEVNPMKIYIDNIVDSLNSPVFNGLEKSLSDIGISVTIDRSKFDKSIGNKICNDFLNGDYIGKEKEILPYLYIYLGSDGYNNIIKTYNGD